MIIDIEDLIKFGIIFKHYKFNESSIHLIRFINIKLRLKNDILESIRIFIIEGKKKKKRFLYFGIPKRRATIISAIQYVLPIGYSTSRLFKTSPSLLLGALARSRDFALTVTCTRMLSTMCDEKY